MQLDSKQVRFGPNELDLDGYQLRRAGVPIPLSRLPLDLLILLVQQRGRLVTREEIAAHLWPQPELVDTVGGINTAIKKIRGALNDDSAHPRFIETVVGRGYRFVGQVEEVETEQKPSSLEPALAVIPWEPLEVEFSQDTAIGLPVITALPGKSRGRLWTTSAAGLVLLLALLLIWHDRPTSTAGALHGTQITSNDTDNRVSAAAISPNGKLLAYADAYGVWLREVNTGVTHQLKAPESLEVNRIAWFADELRLLLTGADRNTGEGQLWTGSLLGAAPLLIRRDARNGVPSPLGDHIAFMAKDDSQIWIANGGGGNARRLLTANPTSKLFALFWLPGGKLLGYQRKSSEPPRKAVASRDIETNYDWRYEVLNAESGKVVTSVDGLSFDSAACTRDGHLWFVRSLPPHDLAAVGLWEVRIDLQNGSLLETARRRAPLNDRYTFNLSAAADGSAIAALAQGGQADVFVGDLHEAELQKFGPTLDNTKRLTFDTHNDYPHAWTADSKAVILESDRAGDYHLYRQALDHHTAELLAGSDVEEVMPQVTPDQHWILYSLTSKDDNVHDSLRRLPVNGGVAAQIPLDRPLDEFRCPQAGGKACVLREREGHESLVFYALDPLRGKGHELARTAWMPTIFGDWAISPDASKIAIPIHEGTTPRIRVVPLDWSYAGRRAEHQINVEATGELWGLSWSVDGLGWYAEMRSRGVSSLQYVDRKGETKVLRQVACNTWGVPSPDGRKLAFVDCSTEQNVWLWK